MELQIKNLKFAYNDKEILKNINLRFNTGYFYSVIGPNGSGKSTLLKNIAKIVSPEENSIMIDNKDITKINKKELSKIISVIPQEINIDYDFTVYDIVLMGRNPYKKFFQDFNANDREIAQKYMKETNTWQLRDKLITELSGGEKQRVIAARALAEEADIFLLDEPTSHLDLQYQIEFLKIFRNLKKDKIIIAVLHDLNLSSIFSDQIILINSGKIIDKGIPSEVISTKNIKDVYNLSVEINFNNNCPSIIPIITEGEVC